MALYVVPAKAGTHNHDCSYLLRSWSWIPAFAGMTRLRRALLVNITVEVLREAFGRRGKLRVFFQMRGIDAVMVGQRQRPGAAWRHRDGLDIEAGQGAGGVERLARADRAFAVATRVERLKWAKDLAERAYDEVMPAYDERGRLPNADMDVFWSIEIAGGAVSEAWADGKLIDDRFIRSFEDWAP